MIATEPSMKPKLRMPPPGIKMPTVMAMDSSLKRYSPALTRMATQPMLVTATTTTPPITREPPRPTAPIQRTTTAMG